MRDAIGWAEMVPRPDGTVYRARKRPHAELLGGDWDDACVIVWRTHDVDVAVALAGDQARREGADLPARVARGWFRSVPWDAGGGYDYSVVNAAPGERGATPGVWFG